MSDSTATSSEGAGDLLVPQVFDPVGGERLPRGLEGTPGNAVLLVAGSVSPLWAADAAVTLSTAWAERDQRVVLADLHLENPLLHERLGMENVEGVVDVFLYGASISRSANPVAGRDFFLITSGTYETDTGAIYRHPRWAKLVAGFREARASLLLFAPARGADLSALGRLVDEVVLLGDPTDVEGLLPSSLRQRVRAVLVPPDHRPPAPAATVREPDARVPLDAHPLSGALEEERELVLPPPPVRIEPKPRRAAPRVAALVLLVVLLAAAGFALARYRPDLVPWLAPAAGAGAAAPNESGSAAAPAPSRAGTPVPFAVLVKSYASLSAAQQQVDAERRRLAETPFYVSPEEDSGVLYFKVYGGLLPDTAAAGRLRERLLQAGSVDADDTLGALSLIHRVHLAFDLGEFGTRAAAAATADSLAAREIPAYVVPIPYTDGSRRWQLYGGAYRDSASADAMRRRLATAGMATRLVLRIGETAPGE